MLLTLGNGHPAVPVEGQATVVFSQDSGHHAQRSVRTRPLVHEPPHRLRHHAPLREALAEKYGPGHEEVPPLRSLVGQRKESVVASTNSGRHQTIRLQQHGGMSLRTTLTFSDDLIHRLDPGKL
ncbi:hypothetical protein ACHMW5_04130 [Azospirillum melinis]|uniref:hypothetical protein n=1 Tax=Azospirillum melinis TaxID=328839 RepID=UPI0037579828